MDLTGSLVDTNLRIFPSETLLEFLKSIPLGEDTPENLWKIIGKESPHKTKLNCDVNKNLPLIQLSAQEIAYLDKIKKSMKENDKTGTNGDCSDTIEDKGNENGNILDVDNDKELDQNVMDDTVETKTELKVQQNQRAYLTTADIYWVYTYLQKRRSSDTNIPYLHELFAGTVVEMPENEVLARNPELEARCVKLRAQQEHREYRQMTRGVDNVRMRFPEDSISYQMKQLNRQLIAILQFLISIFAGFLFGFKGLEWMLGNLDFGFRLLMGVMCALVIALAEIYFLAKKLNEELTIPETVQIGGPPKFVDESLNPKPTKSVKSDKPHQD